LAAASPRSSTTRWSGEAGGTPGCRLPVAPDLVLVDGWGLLVGACKPISACCSAWQVALPDGLPGGLYFPLPCLAGTTPSPTAGCRGRRWRASASRWAAPSWAALCTLWAGLMAPHTSTARSGSTRAPTGGARFPAGFACFPLSFLPSHAECIMPGMVFEVLMTGAGFDVSAGAEEVGRGAVLLPRDSRCVSS
jgi:hypothetical protein